MSYDDPFFIKRGAEARLNESNKEDQTTLRDLLEILFEIGSILKTSQDRAESNLGKELGDPKVKKNTKSLIDMFKSMEKAKLTAIPLQMLVAAFEPLLSILEPFTVIFEIIGSLFEQMAGPILQELFTALQPVFNALIELSPMFVEIGQIIAKLIGAVLTPLLDIFLMLWPAIEAIVKIVISLLEIALKPLELVFTLIAAVIEPLMPVFKALEPLFDTFGDIFGALKPILDALNPAFEALGNILGGALILAIYGVGVAIAAVVDAVTAIVDFIDFLGVTGITATNYLSKWNDLILPIIKDYFTPEAPTTTTSPMGDVVGMTGGFGFAGGGSGRATKATTLMVGEAGPEDVDIRTSYQRPEDIAGKSDMYLSDINDNINMLVTLQNKQLRQSRKRYFG